VDASDEQICECWSSNLWCEGGVVISWYGGDNVPCDSECQYDEHFCAEGCDVEFPVGALGSPPEWFCRETPAAQVGDPCAPLLCLPTRAVTQPDGSVLQTYLECDGASLECIAVPPPSVNGYMDACPSEAAQFGGEGVAGVAAGGGHLCLIAWDIGLGASRHGQTITCVGDWECPQGSSCDDAVVTLPYGEAFEAVCRPGPRGAPLVVHLPPPP
jgi:hypothetical protein